jgi:hypothetical protein
MAIFLPVILQVSFRLHVQCTKRLSLRVEQGVDDFSCESVLLVLVLESARSESRVAALRAKITHHLDNGSPVLGDLGKVERFREVDQVQDILLET